MPQLAFSASGVMSAGRMRTTTIAAFDLAASSSCPWISASSSPSAGKNTAGWALTSWPTSMSDGRIGRPEMSLTTRMPFFQTVWDWPWGSGPRSRSRNTPGSARAPTAPSRELRMSGRRPICDSLMPALRSSSTAMRSSSEDFAG